MFRVFSNRNAWVQLMTKRRRRKPKTAAQIAASKRNLEKARAARKYGHLSPGTYLVKNDGSVNKVTVKPKKALTGKAVRKTITGPTIKFHPYTGKPYDLRNIKGGKKIPLIGLEKANKWLKANTIKRKR